MKTAHIAWILTACLALAPCLARAQSAGDELAAPTAPPSLETPSAETSFDDSRATESQPSDSPVWTIAAWSSVGAVAVSALVVGLTQLRIGEINGDPEWVRARASYPEGTADICTEPSLSPGIQSLCNDAAQMEMLWATAIGAGVTSLVGAVVFFILDATGNAPDESLQVTASATPDRLYLGLTGRF